MDVRMICFFLPFLLFVGHSAVATTSDTISGGIGLRYEYGDYITSKNGLFKLGFFTPPPADSKVHYLGIWFNNYVRVSERRILWVALRDFPLTGGPDRFFLSEDNGNLMLYDYSNTVFMWVSNHSVISKNSSEAVLRNDGNLVLRDKFDPYVVHWQSFDYPQDTLLPGAKGSKSKAKVLKIVLPASIFLLFLVILCILGWIYMFKWKKKKADRGLQGLLDDLLKNKSTYNDTPNTNMLNDCKTEGETQELQIFNLVCLATATNDFCLENKVGQGGFGPVYKGKLRNGKQIAVKRLSKTSKQGIKEFENEIVFISKLQHRNLVKLLGCCVQGNEKMLIYEYMPNGSLDAFLFDPKKKNNLDWDKRFQIIGGIARGLLYLHRDSRLRVIHRDLKVNNILLDEDMTPKISDFGMARRFCGNQSIDNTSQPVGTRGYMSPEYINDGIFSEKSDVYSFGVLVLEVVSGKRNHRFNIPDQPSVNLLIHAWNLWNDNKCASFIDEALHDLYPIPEDLLDKYFSPEVKKCIHVALLCVQYEAKDRPNMAEVDRMLNCNTISPVPEAPYIASSDFPENVQSQFTVNNVSLSTLAGR